MFTLSLPGWFPRAATPFPAAPPRYFTLPIGQQETVDLLPGQVLRVVEGRVELLSAPRAVGDGFVRARVTLRAGDVHVSADRETVSLSAADTARVERLPG